MVDPLRRAIEENRRMRDKIERAQYEVYDRLWETDEAISNRVRFFAAGVLAVSWGLLVQETGADDHSAFDMRLILVAAIFSVLSLVFDFLYLTFKRSALMHSARHRSGRDVDGSGPNRALAGLSSWLRVVLFCAAAAVLIYAVIMALLPVLAAPS